MKGPVMSCDGNVEHQGHSHNARWSAQFSSCGWKHTLARAATCSEGSETVPYLEEVVLDPANGLVLGDGEVLKHGEVAHVGGQTVSLLVDGPLPAATATCTTRPVRRSDR